MFLASRLYLLAFALFVGGPVGSGKTLAETVVSELAFTVLWELPTKKTPLPWNL
jgi:deoxyadenosine/deoxycytidine kinase